MARFLPLINRQANQAVCCADSGLQLICRSVIAFKSNVKLVLNSVQN
ncbi:hypothetical protein CIT292_09689 [Citrobacter youngae ATCC 29220]|uniref:Uncharacterized protein n=1 Tax=Citrobacter youngae ATCC 29220 TaxID=500640 RepID=D4BGN9_9ENTR|nr:hypothetical protein CIT292_09689 [Citrobacter youngae ATCC 29220]